MPWGGATGYTTAYTSTFGAGHQPSFAMQQPGQHGNYGMMATPQASTRSMQSPMSSFGGAYSPYQHACGPMDPAAAFGAGFAHAYSSAHHTYANDAINGAISRILSGYRTHPLSHEVPKSMLQDMRRNEEEKRKILEQKRLEYLKKNPPHPAKNKPYETRIRNKVIPPWEQIGPFRKAMRTWGGLWFWGFFVGSALCARFYHEYKVLDEGKGMESNCTLCVMGT